MADKDIRQIYKELEQHYEDGGYVSRASIFMRAWQDGLITKDVVEKARDYYGSLWNYVGD